MPRENEEMAKCQPVVISMTKVIIEENNEPSKKPGGWQLSKAGAIGNGNRRLIGVAKAMAAAWRISENSG
jgi:hypothetical protein